MQFTAKHGDKASTAKDRGLDKACNGLLLKICQKYDNLAEVDKLASVAKKVDSVKLVMQENVDLALQNCVKLESIEKAAGKCFQSIIYLYLTMALRGASAASWCFQAKRQRVEEQDVVEEHQGEQRLPTIPIAYESQGVVFWLQMKLIIGFIILAILGIIIGVIVAMSKKK